jgi:hypothetical protein
MRQFDGSQWLDAADVAALAGGNVTTWTARQGVSPTQGSAAKRPTMNGSRKVVVFDGIDDCLVGDCGVTGYAQATAIIFLERGSQLGPGIVLETTTASFNQNGLQFYQEAAPFQNSQSIGSATLSTFRKGKESGPRSVNGGACNRAANPDTIESIWNGGIDDTPYGRQVNSTGGFGAGSTYYGSRYNGTAYPYSGGIACVLVFRSLLTYEQMCAVASKYRKVWRF